MLTDPPLTKMRVSETPVSVIDLETTGLTPGFDRVVEVSVVRLEPGKKPDLVFDTLVNPRRKVAGTEIHGITDQDVRDAPTFDQIVGDLVEALSGSVIAAYNVYFDKRFLDFELSQAGTEIEYPHFCVMYLRSMLKLGKRCSLEDACKLYDIDYAATHMASDDAAATARLLQRYQAEAEQQGIGTFSELARRRTYKFNQSFTLPVMPAAVHLGLQPQKVFQSRVGSDHHVDPVQDAFASYWELLKAIVADLEVSTDELEQMKQERAATILSKEQIRVLHARAFSSAISQFISDQWLDDREVLQLRKLHECLRQLGWAPGM